MSKLKYGWWPYVKYMVRNYPQLCREWEELKTISATPDYSAIGHGSGVSKPTEQVALRLLPKDKQKEFDAVREALRETERGPDGRHRITLVRLVYWRRTHNLAGAAQVVGISERTAKRWNVRFLRLVGEKYGFDIEKKSIRPKHGTSEPKKHDMMIP